MPYVDSGYVAAGYFGQAGSLCAFFCGAESLIFDQPPQRPPRSYKLIQAEKNSTGGDVLGYPVFARDKTLTLSWPRMHSFYLEQLRDWFKRVAKGMAILFSYRQVDGTLLTVRFGSPTIKVRPVMPDRHQVDIVLWVEA